MSETGNRDEVRAYSGRTPPNAAEAERWLLGGLLQLQDAGAIDQVSQLVKADDFYLEKNSAVYEAIIGLQQKHTPIDLVTVGEALRTNGKYGLSGGQEYLIELMDSVASAANCEHHAMIVREKSVLRRLIQAGNSVIRQALDAGADSKDVINIAEKSIFEIAQGQTRQSLRPVSDFLREVLDKLDRSRSGELSGVPTGFTDLDQLTDGLQATDLIVLAGRPAMGKTAFALSLLANAAILYQKKCAFFSLEMGAEQLVMRMLASRGRVQMQSIKKGRLAKEDVRKLVFASGELNGAPIFLDDQPGLGMSDLRSKCRLLQRQQGLDLVVVDYLQLMMESGSGGRGPENRQQEIATISRGLKMLAKELKIPILVLSQLSREAEKRAREKNPKPPMLSDLRESGAIEQDADQVWFVHRPYVYDNTHDMGPNFAQLIVAKHRNGPTDEIKMTFTSEFATFENFIADQFAPGGEEIF